MDGKLSRGTNKGRRRPEPLKAKPSTQGSQVTEKCFKKHCEDNCVFRKRASISNLRARIPDDELPGLIKSCQEIQEQLDLFAQYKAENDAREKAEARKEAIRRRTPFFTSSRSAASLMIARTAEDIPKIQRNLPQTKKPFCVGSRKGIPSLADLPPLPAVKIYSNPSSTNEADSNKEAELPSEPANGSNETTVEENKSTSKESKTSETTEKEKKKKDKNVSKKVKKEKNANKGETHQQDGVPVDKAESKGEKVKKRSSTKELRPPSSIQNGPKSKEVDSEQLLENNSSNQAKAEQDNSSIKEINVDLHLKRSLSFGGDAMKYLLYSCEIPEPKENVQLKEKEKERKEERKQTTPDSDINQYDPVHSKARHAHSFGGSETKDLLYGGSSAEFGHVSKSNCSSNNETKGFQQSSANEHPQNVGSLSFDDHNETGSEFDTSLNLPEDVIESDFYTADEESLCSNRTDVTAIYVPNFKQKSCHVQQPPNNSNMSTENSEYNAVASSDADLDFLENMRVNRTACLGGSSMKDLIYNAAPSQDLPKIEKKHPEYIPSSLNQEMEDVSEDNLKQFRANRTACLGGDSMRDLLYKSLNGNDQTGDENINKGLNSCSEIQLSQQEELIVNQKTCQGGEDEIQLMYEPGTTGEASEEGLRADRTAYLGVNHTTNQDDAGRSDDFRANRIACLGGESMRSLIYETQIESANFSKNDSNVSKAKNINSRPGARTDTRNDNSSMAKNRSASMGGNSMKNLLYGPTKPASCTSVNTTRSGPQQRPINSYKGNNTIRQPIPEYESNSNMHLEGPGSKNGKQLSSDNLTTKTGGLGGDTMKNLIYGTASASTDSGSEHAKVNHFKDGDSFPKKVTQVVYDQKIYEDSAPGYNSGLGGDYMKNLIYSGGSMPWNGRMVKPTDQTVPDRIYHPEDADFLKKPPKSVSRTRGNKAKFSNFHRSIDRSRTLVPYNFLRSFQPDFDNNLERAAVNIKFGSYLNCTCVNEEETPCIKHLDPSRLQYFAEASKILKIVNKPINEKLEKAARVVERKFAAKYPYYYENVVREYPRKLTEEFRDTERTSKSMMVTSFRRLMQEEQTISKYIKSREVIGNKRNITLSVNESELDKDFTKVCEFFKNHYPGLFVRHIERLRFPQLAYDKSMVEQNRYNLITLSKVDPKRLKELDTLSKMK